MEFPIAIHKDDGTVLGVAVPNIPGVHSWGETMGEAIDNTRIAIASHVETLLALGEDVQLTCSTLEELVPDPDYAGAVWAKIEVELPRRT
ncbi:type II toxin-antitoxin system HicB family antitoxin [Burkholderia metallica]|uniref:Type II toxin-antitoxin system HicB family antitoxin n=1 Tax=Burkholderia metallica TaxID=488729 RepID=A0ABT8PAZ4_9BURK|nr:type II toxin-antitoxin system HicB family antitoxin [Burkholderia metallica]MDN7932042.1 type II toxin-antitoxin system HicB family antitoxin [Burkholderia metallica]